MKITHAVLCAAAIAMATTDAKVTVKADEEADMDAEHHDEEHVEDKHDDEYEKSYGVWQPEGGEWVELFFGLHLGYFKNMWKYERDYDCKSLMFAWAYRIYNFYNIANGTYTLEDNPVNIGVWGIYFAYDGYKAIDTCWDDRDLVVDASSDDDDGADYFKGINGLVSAALSIRAMP
eukprot:CAMPEP_0176380742 /NCGR_PEP_ID=MMETSP0126-20121128/31351_1 /TAXON_ID=141414 ORGANISM="Strombidinopsis acuminatum, Strain SPMC142" /NCGR_SAMPLE_ID=MMETSP0126 /ASSEMBLY_ACC=CAM_ASM_000229 /LENGTH=175 /DNA_ID=CAMNT_0017744201 /DNA_START=17 /DNA_END=544 /DNA_ORIENTATION=-